MVRAPQTPEEGLWAVAAHQEKRERHTVTTLALKDMSTAVSGVAFHWPGPGPATSPPLRTVAREEATDPDQPQTRE